ncbi:MAG: hypothetical protein CME06_07445 [Gemmatimonadetes bacterium]|nr:hypothetical protein [Gemmatimonadota bacterium]
MTRRSAHLIIALLVAAGIAQATYPELDCLLATPEFDLIGTATQVVVLGSDEEGAPTALARVPISGGVWAIAFEDGLAIVATGSDTVLSVDLTDPASPERIGGYLPTLGESHISSVALAPERGYLRLRDGGLEILDLTDPASPTLAGTWDSRTDSGPGVAAGPEGAVYLACDDAGAPGWWLDVVDASDPEAPVRTDSLDLPDPAWLWPLSHTPIVSTGSLLLTPFWGGLTAWDLNDPFHPSRNWSAAVPGEARMSGIAATASFSTVKAGSRVPAASCPTCSGHVSGPPAVSAATS